MNVCVCSWQVFFVIIKHIANSKALFDTYKEHGK